MTETPFRRTAADGATDASVQRQDAARALLLGHDLRAAVADVIGGLRLIDHSGLDEATCVQLERIRAAGETLARLLDEGLALMQGAEAGHPAAPMNVQMSRFLYDLEMRWSGRAREKGLAFRVVVSPDVPGVVSLDRVALERVLGNVLSNAVKYTDRGAVELGVELSEDGALRFWVADDGPGFSGEALSRLFQFAGRPEGTSKPGQGLGMHITKELLDRIGGRIRVENRPERGAEVEIELPARFWSPAEPEAEVELPDLSRVKVLVADDTPTNQTLVSQMLSRMGAEVEIASDGVEALHWLERERFDVALIDIEMPRLSGLDVIRAIRTNERPNDRQQAVMPVVALTAFVVRAQREAIYAAGADAILAKPLGGPETLGMTLAAVLGRQSGTCGPDDGAADGAAPDVAPDFDRARFDHLLDISGPDGARELLDRLQSDLARSLQGLRDGLAAGDRACIRAETHVLIALGGAVGSNRVRALAERINAAAHAHHALPDPADGAELLREVAAMIAFAAAERARLEVPG